ncbi:FAD/NAD(P)-binding protein [Nakamurella flava]|uniref:FAD/NAD(P)-binding protein n=1 Tax=Nakamurella flava TaxID=2576308 RepID=A0A4U6QK62_9ACTN|nr:FAD/NAD(P)-binding protein [Nakamurella flava]TKV60844.1 FAD/NAD(P)-binding protein [Nakamurella flava]
MTVRSDAARIDRRGGRPADATPRHRRLVVVGGGPRAFGVLERIAANAQRWPAAAELEIVVVDPHPAGAGRIWRDDQSGLLWMNSVARDVTVFPDTSVTMAGPVVAGPALHEWMAGEGRPGLAAAGLLDEADVTGPDGFASRRIQSRYLDWAWRRVLAALPPAIRVTQHTTTALAVTDTGSARQQVDLADGTTLTADAVVLAQGYLDRSLSDADQAFARAAERHALTYIPPGPTADLDLSALGAGESVVVRGMGLAFVDLVVLLTQGRGGRFHEEDGRLRYEASGAEPVLYVGSRRGVPYHAKLGYRRSVTGPATTRYLTAAAVAALPRNDRGHLDFRKDVWPLVVRELAVAHYEELFSRHPDRTTVPWSEFLHRFENGFVVDTLEHSSFGRYLTAAVPAAADHFDLPRIDRPFAGHRFADAHAVDRAVADHVAEDLRRRADPSFSPDAAVFDALLAVFGALAGALRSGSIGPADRVRWVENRFHGLFSFLASGPPPRRLVELLALQEAGLVHFLGPDITVQLRGGRFVASSPAAPGTVTTRALVDARLTRPDVLAATDPIIRGLLATGQLAAEDIVDDDGVALGGGQLLADASGRAIRADGSVHLRRFLLGPSVSGSAGSAGFARPGFNGPGFRQNDAVARDLLELLSADVHSGSAAGPHTRDPRRPTLPADHPPGHRATVDHHLPSDRKVAVR